MKSLLKDPVAVIGTILAVVVLLGAFYVSYVSGTRTETHIDDQALEQELAISTDTWRARMERGWPADDGCDIRTASVELAPFSPYAQTITFEYTHCDSYALSFRNTGSQIVPITGGEYALDDVSGNDIEGRPIVDYWILEEGQDTKKFIASLVSALPHPLARANCKVKDYIAEDGGVVGIQIPGETLFAVYPTEAFYEQDPEAAYQLCSPLRNMHAIQFFKRVENVLLLVHVGHDTPQFNPTSFEVH